MMNTIPATAKILRIGLVHIHIGKTSGTSFAKSINDALGPDTCSPPFIQTRMTAEEAEGYARYPIVHGHISRADQRRWFPERGVLTILREPIDRGLSFIHYVRSLDPRSSQVAYDASRLDVLDLIETKDALENLDNTIVRQLGGHMLDRTGDPGALLEAAKATLREAVWVGFHQSIAADLARLGEILETDLRPSRENVTPNRRALVDEDSAVIERLHSLSAYDRELFAWAKTTLR